MAKILDEFIRVMPRLQARNIEKDLQDPNSRLRAGNFREAFQEALRELLESGSPIRFKEPGLQARELRDSEQITDALNKLAGDLTALFAEADLVLTIEKLQETVYRDEVIAKLRRAVDEAETEIERLELLKGNVSGLKEAIIEKFRASASRLPRTDSSARLAYVDPKLHTRIRPEFDMPVGLDVGGLVLPIDSRDAIRPSRIQDVLTSDVFTDTDRFALPRATIPSTAGDASYTGAISNVIDNTEDTFWIKELLTQEDLPAGARLNIQIDLGRAPVVCNYVEIHPIGDFETQLDELYYVDELGAISQIELQNSPLVLKDKVRIFFREASIRKLVCIFTQQNHTAVDGRKRYRFGFDNIVTGKLSYRANGYYVSKTLSLNHIGKLFLGAKENSFVGVPGGGDASPTIDPLPPVEYWVYYRDIDDSGNIVFDTYLPIMPAGRTSVTEKVVLGQNDRGLISFALDKDIADDAPELVVYRDGAQILRPGEYSYEGPAATIAEPSVLDIPEGFREDNEYIAVYTPIHTDSTNAPMPFTDGTGLIRYCPDNTIDITRPAASRAVTSEVNLIIIMRGTGVHTSVVDEVTFAVA